MTKWLGGLSLIMNYFPHRKIRLLNKTFLVFIQSMFDSIKCCLDNYQASYLLFKYYLSKLEGGSKIRVNMLTNILMIPIRAVE